MTSMKFARLLLLAASLIGATHAQGRDKITDGAIKLTEKLNRTPRDHDIVVYGGTASAVIAAVQAKKMGKSVIVVSPDKHLGGLASGGLGFTDTGNKAVIGGLSRDFYHRVWLHYDKPEPWVQQKKSEYGNQGQGTPAMDGTQRTMWIFEPHVAAGVFEDFVKENGIEVVRDEWLDRAKGVKKDGDRITSITTLSGKTYAGKMFIDATYEGDLMAAAGVDYHVGREAQSVYDEKWAGVQVGVLHHGHHFGKMNISPYVVPGDPKSGVLPHISTEPPGEYGAGDKKVQAYCFRMCLTNDPSNRIPFPKPAGYDAKEYELLLRVYEKGWKETFGKFDPIPNHKTDTNNHGPFSTDNIGANWDYPEASYERRREIIADHERYQKGWLYFIANDPRVPKDVQEEMQTWGLPKDEFTDNGNWSHQLYIREARRMTGSYVMTENELLKKRPTPDSVGMGSYGIDSHNIQRYITPEGYVQNEGDIGTSTKGPYEIAYGSLVPKKGQCANLLVPVACSASHIAYGSIRMEPVFMILGQSAATAAVFAIDDKLAVQDVPYAKLRDRLLKDGQVLHYDGPKTSKGIDPKTIQGIVVDDANAKLTGEWSESGAAKAFIGDGYSHDGNARDGKASARFEAKLEKGGTYRVMLASPPNNNRASNAPVEIHHRGGVQRMKINLKAPKAGEGVFWIDLGAFEYAEGDMSVVVITNKHTDGYVVVDGVRWVSE
jgi:FAD dependent oxidoreductase